MPLPSSGSAKRSSFFALVFYVHKTVQAMTTSPLFFADPGIYKNDQIPVPPLEPPKWHFFGRSRGHGAHDNVGTWPRAREKRETKRTTRDREEQLEVRGAFCFPFLARARAYSVGTGAPACTDRPPPGGGTPLPRPPTLAPGATFGAAAVPRGLTSRELTVPSKGCRPQKKNS